MAAALKPRPGASRRSLLHLAAAATAVPLVGCASARDPDRPKMREHEHELDLGPFGTWRGWMAEPTTSRAAPLPLIIFLHGSGERGPDLDRVRRNGQPDIVRSAAREPCRVWTPLLERGRWAHESLHAMREALLHRWPGQIAPSRISVIGLSLGGFGAWTWATAWPGDLCAIAPICGFAPPEMDICRMRGVPVRAFHGDRDPLVPAGAQAALVERLRRCGGDADLTLYEGVGHDSWTFACRESWLVPWLTGA